MKINTSRLRRFVQLASGPSIGYQADKKRQFRLDALFVLKAIADLMELQKDEFEIRWNEGGIAVSGEATLHSNEIYIQFAQSAGGGNASFMWRTCKGQKDYTGGFNRWANWKSLLNLDTFVERVLEVRAQIRGTAELGVLPRVQENKLSSALA